MIVKQIQRILEEMDDTDVVDSFYSELISMLSELIAIKGKMVMLNAVCAKIENGEIEFEI